MYLYYSTKESVCQDMKCPCIGCKDRSTGTAGAAGCHNDKCPHGWAEWKADQERSSENRRDFIAKDRAITGVLAIGDYKKGNKI